MYDLYDYFIHSYFYAKVIFIFGYETIFGLSIEVLAGRADNCFPGSLCFKFAGTLCSSMRVICEI